MVYIILKLYFIGLYKPVKYLGVGGVDVCLSHFILEPAPVYTYTYTYTKPYENNNNFHTLTHIYQDWV